MIIGIGQHARILELPSEVHMQSCDTVLTGVLSVISVVSGLNPSHDTTMESLRTFPDMTIAVEMDRKPQV